MIGRTIAHYRILEELGSGGMGVVFRARDSKLGRDVAIKTLPEGSVDVAERLERFRLEAKTLARLNHSNIAAIYDVQEVDGQVALVLELVDGETLAERLKRGPLSASRAIEIAAEIAQAMDAAHQAGVIHRDLKPSNIKLTANGDVKVLDFGLAALVPPRSVEMSDSTEVSTLTGPPSDSPGAGSGTAPYMSPEQIRGESLDERSDVWAFGCLLFELLTRQRAFQGETRSDVLAAVLRDSPNWEWLPEGTPSSLLRLLDWCLAKRPQKRLRSLGDAAFFLEVTAEEGSPDYLGRKAPAVGLRRLGAIVLVAILGLVLGYVLADRSRGVDSERPLLISMAPPEDLRPAQGWGPSLAMSPDGKTIAYVLERGTKTVLSVKEAMDLEARAIEGTDGARTPFFSPDGAWIGYFDTDERRLKKVMTSGGEPLDVAAADSHWGAVWTPDDTIVFSSDYVGLVRVGSDGGEVETVTEAGSAQHNWPSLLPDGETVLFTMLPERGSFDGASIGVVSVDGGTPEVVLDSAYFPHYSAGHLLYVSKDRVYAVPFDPRQRRLTGTPVSILQEVWTSSWTGYADMAFSRNGTVIYVSGGPDATRASVVSVDRNGEVVPLLEERKAYRVPRLSPDGRYLAYAITDENVDLWLYDLERASPARITDSPSWDGYPIWGPGADEITFASTRRGLPSIFVRDRATEKTWQLFESEFPCYPASWSPDGERLAFWQEHPMTGLDIWIYSRQNGATEPFLRSRHNESAPEFSPDGSFIAYESDETQQVEVYVRPFPEVSPAVPMSIDGGRSPRWSRDGSKLFFMIDGTLKAVPLGPQQYLEPGEPAALFRGPYGRSYDVDPSRESFVLVQEMAEDDPPLRTYLLVGWNQTLER